MCGTSPSAAKEKTSATWSNLFIHPFLCRGLTSVRIVPLKQRYAAQIIDTAMRMIKMTERMYVRDSFSTSAGGAMSSSSTPLPNGPPEPENLDKDPGNLKLSQGKDAEPLPKPKEPDPPKGPDPPKEPKGPEKPGDEKE
eukprot:218310-Rhodomonas_salina.2